MTAIPCPACGHPASGKFCSACGASLEARACAGCRADLSPRARYCHRCGRPVGRTTAITQGLPLRERRAWVLAGSVCVVLLLLIVFKVMREAHPTAAPEMANAGAESAREGPGGDVSGSAGGSAPPDISQMSPRERFDRLFNRIMQAAQQGDTAQVLRFTPMALGAYTQLDSIDADARYHAAVLRMQVGDFPGALALADSILMRNPGHLFGYMVRGSVAELQNDSTRLRQAQRDFRAHFSAESAAGRPEYQEHDAVVEDFKQSAAQSNPGARAR